MYDEFSFGRQLAIIMNTALFQNAFKHPGQSIITLAMKGAPEKICCKLLHILQVNRRAVKLLHFEHFAAYPKTFEEAYIITRMHI